LWLAGRSETYFNRSIPFLPGLLRLRLSVASEALVRFKFLKKAVFLTTLSLIQVKRAQAGLRAARHYLFSVRNDSDSSRKSSFTATAVGTVTCVCMSVCIKRLIRRQYIRLLDTTTKKIGAKEAAAWSGEKNKIKIKIIK
jgi:hypothetical protein